MKISEYDAFGPWIYKIDEGHEIPKAFLTYVDENDNAKFRLKVPKKIERRDATPDMDLYEYLLSVYDDRIELLQLLDEGVRLQKVEYSKVCSVVVFRELLFGRLSVYLGDDTFTFEYNAVSQDLIMEVVACIRKGYQNGEIHDESATAYDPTHLKMGDLFFINEWVRLEPKERPIEHCAYQASHALPDTGIAGVVKEDLAGTLHIRKAQEWVVLQKPEDYSYEYQYLPRNASAKIETGVSTEYPGIAKMTYTLGNFSTEVLYDADNTAIDDHYRG